MILVMSMEEADRGGGALTGNRIFLLLDKDVQKLHGIPQTQFGFTFWWNNVYVASLVFQSR